jgi:glycosyltransferase involved in cell wall biosynthesis
MKQMKPLVSVIMPVKDAGRFVGAAVESIVKQTHANWEMIVVDDGSSDETGKILKKFAKKDRRIKVITHKVSKGIGASLNQALFKAHGEFVARMDGDDIALSNRIATQVAFLQKNSEIVAVGGQVEMIDGAGEIFAYKHFPTNPTSLREMIMWMVPIQHPVMMVRGEVYKKCRYDEKLKTAEDVDMMMQLLEHGEFGNVSETVYQYRKVDTSNGYHNVKQTFWLTTLGRMRGILHYSYKPSVKGIMLSLLQIAVVGILPSKLVVRMYESKRFFWLIQEKMGRVWSTIFA